MANETKYNLPRVMTVKELSEYLRVIEPCQAEPKASAEETVTVRCDGANSTWAFGKRSG